MGNAQPVIAQDRQRLPIDADRVCIGWAPQGSMPLSCHRSLVISPGNTDTTLTGLAQPTTVKWEVIPPDAVDRRSGLTFIKSYFKVNKYSAIARMSSSGRFEPAQVDLAVTDLGFLMKANKASAVIFEPIVVRAGPVVAPCVPI
jgi:hypothetical protein